MRSRKPKKDKQYNDQKKKEKQNITYNTKYRETRNAYIVSLLLSIVILAYEIKIIIISFPRKGRSKIILYFS